MPYQSQLALENRLLMKIAKGTNSKVQKQLLYQTWLLRKAANIIVCERPKQTPHSGRVVPNRTWKMLLIREKILIRDTSTTTVIRSVAYEHWFKPALRTNTTHVLYYPHKQAESPFSQQKKTNKQRLKHIETNWNVKWKNIFLQVSCIRLQPCTCNIDECHTRPIAVWIKGFAVSIASFSYLAVAMRLLDPWNEPLETSHPAKDKLRECSAISVGKQIAHEDCQRH